MSIHAMTAVFDHSRARLGARLVMLCLADHADAQGRNAWPSKSRIAAHCLMSERQVQRAIKDLERDGEIVVDWQQGPRGTNSITVTPGGMAVGNVTPDKMSPVTNPAPRVSEMSPEPSMNHPLESFQPTVENSCDAGTSRPRNEGWDALVTVFYQPSADEGKRWGLLAKRLNGYGHGPPELLLAAQRYREEMPDAVMTPEALVKHAPRLLAPTWQPPKTRRQAETERIYSGLFAESVQHGGLGGAGRIHQGGLPELEGGGDDG